MIPKTMALKITKKNWSVVIGCMGVNFAIESPSLFLGSYLVINEVGLVHRRGSEFGSVKQPLLTLSNTCMPKEELLDKYDVVGQKDPEDTTGFFEISHK